MALSLVGRMHSSEDHPLSGPAVDVVAVLAPR